MAYPYLLLDVFTEQAFGGNPLAVFPHAKEIDRSLLQPIARELNLTETAFVYPARSPEASAALRIFTPDAEVPFAGHPVVGAAFALEHAGLLDAGCSEIAFEVESTSVPVRLLRSTSGSLLQATMTQQRPVFLGQFPRCELVAGALGLQPSDLAITGLPCEVVSTGLPVHIVPVGGLDAMRRIALRPSRLKDVKEALGFADLFVFCFETEDPTATVHCRMFAPGFGIPEDPATGAASGALGAYLVRRKIVPEKRLTQIVCEQGIEMGRPSRVLVEVECEADRIAAVRVGGSAVIVGEGILSV
jgi:trans-2,3-dihydro-3-hydroxyanthranilate isomerase